MKILKQSIPKRLFDQKTITGLILLHWNKMQFFSGGHRVKHKLNQNIQCVFLPKQTNA